MEPNGPRVHIEKDAARAGSTPHIVRYVLLISLVLAIVAMTVIWVTGAFNSADDTGGQSDSTTAVTEQTQKTQ